MLEARAHRTTVKAWMIAYGEDELRQARRDHLTVKYAKLGQRIPGVRPGRGGIAQRQRALALRMRTQAVQVRRLSSLQIRSPELVGSIL